MIKDDQTVWEKEPLTSLANNRELMALEHNGYRQPLDTMRDMMYLEELWSSKNAPWKIWDD